MFLPNTKNPLLDLATQAKVNHSLVLNFIESGGLDFWLMAWNAYAAQELTEKSLLEKMTPVGGLDLGRRLFAQIGLDFQEQFERQTKE